MEKLFRDSIVYDMIRGYSVKYVYDRKSGEL